MVQVNFWQTLTFDLAPQIINKQYTWFVFPPPPPLLTTTQRRHITACCPQPPTPTWRWRWHGNAKPQTQAAHGHDRQQCPQQECHVTVANDWKVMECAGDNMATCHVVQTVTMLAIITVCILLVTKSNWAPGFRSSGWMDFNSFCWMSR